LATFNYDPQTFVCPPDVSTYSARNITKTSALLRAGLTNDYGDPTECRFRYWIDGQQIATEQTTDWQPVAKDAIFTELISDLMPNSLYRYVAEARNSGGMDIGSIRSFTTLSTDPNIPPDPNTPPDPNIPLDPQTLYVDDNALGDPGPNDLDVSDPNEDGSMDHPFDSIQEAIEDANDFDTIQVAPGRYYERINLMGKAIHLNGLDPIPANMTDLPIIDAIHLGTVITCNQNEDPNCLITGFVLTRGYGGLAGAIACIGSSPEINHCLMVGNRFTDPNGGVVYLKDSNSVFAHATIADNALVSSGAGLNGGAGLSLLNSQSVFKNSILWNNHPKEVQFRGLSALDLTYSTVSNGWPGEGNLSTDPLFASPGMWVDVNDSETFLAFADPNAIWLDGDYHLMSAAGRWNPVTDIWENDDVTSPAIQRSEYTRTGLRFNQGAYGRTSQASLSDISEE
jgi:hypothetical protein